MSGIDKLIYQKLAEKLATLSWVKCVNWKKLKIANSDFRDTELPCIQFYDAGQTFKHEQGRILVEWDIAIELLLKSKSSGEVDQLELLEKRQELEQLIGDARNFGIQGLIHFEYVRNEMDLHTIEPIYYSVLIFKAVYYKQFNTSC